MTYNSRMIAAMTALVLALSACSQENTDSQGDGETATTQAADTATPDAGETGEAVDEMGRGQWVCYSGRNCSGKVLSNRDPHNCKTKSNGKSIYNATTGVCSNL